MNIGNRVKLNTFNGSKKAPSGCDPKENYWKLVGSTGIIVQDPNEKTIYASFSMEKKVLVKFDIAVTDLGLHSHNNIPNALWILETDILPT